MADKPRSATIDLSRMHQACDDIKLKQSPGVPFTVGNLRDELTLTQEKSRDNPTGASAMPTVSRILEEIKANPNIKEQIKQLNTELAPGTVDALRQAHMDALKNNGAEGPFKKVGPKQFEPDPNGTVYKIDEKKLPDLQQDLSNRAKTILSPEFQEAHKKINNPGHEAAMNTHSQSQSKGFVRG